MGGAHGAANETLADRMLFTGIHGCATFHYQVLTRERVNNVREI